MGTIGGFVVGVVVGIVVTVVGLDRVIEILKETITEAIPLIIGSV